MKLIKRSELINLSVNYNNKTESRRQILQEKNAVQLKDLQKVQFEL